MYLEFQGYTIMAPQSWTHPANISINVTFYLTKAVFLMCLYYYYYLKILFFKVFFKGFCQLRQWDHGITHYPVMDHSTCGCYNELMYCLLVLCSLMNTFMQFASQTHAALRHFTTQTYVIRNSTSGVWPLSPLPTWRLRLTRQKFCISFTFLLFKEGQTEFTFK